MVNNKKVLILGCGSIGKRHARALNCLGVNNISFCDTDKSKLEEISKEIKPTAVYLSYDEALNQKFDAVFICTPPALHVNQALKAIRSDCDVFIEKPLSTKLDGINVLEAEMINLKKLRNYRKKDRLLLWRVTVLTMLRHLNKPMWESLWGRVPILQCKVPK